MWEIPMLVTGGLFAGVVAFVAWERIPAWRSMDAAEFQRHFRHSIHKADRLQPALLVVWLASTIGFAVATDGTAGALAAVAGGGGSGAPGGGGAFFFPPSGG